MDIKLIATDVDGTLVGADHMVIPKVNIEAMNSFTPVNMEGLMVL